MIAELAPYDKRGRLSVLNAMGDQAGAHIRRVLPKALQSHAEAWLVTHVPPLREACRHQGRLSDDEWAPHFTCKAVGDAILDVMRAHPTRRLTVPCGHTHGSGQTQPLPNVTIWTGGAEYQHPRINQVFDRP